MRVFWADGCDVDTGVTSAEGPALSSATSPRHALFGVAVDRQWITIGTVHQADSELLKSPLCVVESSFRFHPELRRISSVGRGGTNSPTATLKCMAATHTSVFLVDDHPIIRDGFRLVLEDEEGVAVCGEADSGEETLEKIPDANPDLAVVDISMDGMDGLELTRRLKEADPSMKILIVSMHGEPRYVEDALEAGATGYAIKDNVHAVLPEAVRVVAGGGVYLCDEMEDKM